MYFYRPQRSCGQGYVFTRVCDSVNGGGCLRRTPQTKENPPGTRQTPRGPRRTPPRKNTAAYGQWAAGTHPTGNALLLWIGTEGEFEFSRNTQSWSCWHFYTTIVTPPSLEPTTSCTPVQHSTAKPKIQTQARGQHYTPPSFLESLVFSLTRHHRLLPNQSPGQDKQTPLAIESTMLNYPRPPCFCMHMSQHFWHQMLWLHWVSNPQPLHTSPAFYH